MKKVLIISAIISCISIRIGKTQSYDKLKSDDLVVWKNYEHKAFSLKYPQTTEIEIIDSPPQNWTVKFNSSESWTFYVHQLKYMRRDITFDKYEARLAEGNSSILYDYHNFKKKNKKSIPYYKLVRLTKANNKERGYSSGIIWVKNGIVYFAMFYCPESLIKSTKKIRKKFFKEFLIK